MPQEPKKKNKKSGKPSRKRVVTIAIVAGAMVLAGSTGLLVRWLQSQQQDDQDAEIVGLLDNPRPKDVTEAERLASEGKYDEANKVIENSLKSADNDKKYELYLQQGVNYEVEGNNQKALESYQKALEVKQTFTIYRAIGRLAETLGNPQLALDSYKKALPLVDNNSPMADAERRRLEEKIKALGG